MHSKEEAHMDPRQKEKWERYMRNAERFMWGVIPGNKRAVFTQLQTLLKELGQDSATVSEHQKATYSMLTENILSKLGIERVIREIVAGEVKRQFEHQPGALDFLRAHWLSGTLPRWQTLQSLRTPRTVKQRLLDAVEPKKDTREIYQQTSDILDAFVEVNTQYRYVHGWTVFAGLWFEEIEPLLKEGVREHTA
jgi:regulator of replication initiation timing